MKKCAYNRLNLIDRKFGKLLIINKFRKNLKRNVIEWLCKCECGNEIYVNGSSLKSGHTKSCGCTQNLKGKYNHKYNGYEDISGSYWSDIKIRAQSRNQEFSITIEYAWKIFLKQNQKCKYTGLLLTHTQKSRKIRGTASLDRIDSSKGYIEGNVQWVHKDINNMKQAFSTEKFIEYCGLVYNKDKGKINETK